MAALDGSMVSDAGSGGEQQKVASVERALSILEAFSDGSVRLGLGEIADRTGLYRSTILRLTASLERFGYIFREGDGRFRLGPTLWRLGAQYQSAFDLAEYVRPVLDTLVESTGETAAFYIKEGSDRICLYRRHSPRILRHHIEEGARLPLDRGASAHILVAHTGGGTPADERTRREGYYVSLGERDPETAAIAVPIFGQHGSFVGALGVTGSRSRFVEGHIAALVEHLRGAGAGLSRSLGARC